MATKIFDGNSGNGPKVQAGTYGVPGVPISVQNTGTIPLTISGQSYSTSGSPVAYSYVLAGGTSQALPANADRYIVASSDSPTTMIVSYTPDASASNGTSGQATKEAFTGNGTQTTFQLKHPPISGTDLVFVAASSSSSYSVMGSTIVFNTAPANGASIFIYYSY